MRPLQNCLFLLLSGVFILSVCSTGGFLGFSGLFRACRTVGRRAASKRAYARAGLGASLIILSRL